MAILRILENHNITVISRRKTFLTSAIFFTFTVLLFYIINETTPVQRSKPPTSAHYYQGNNIFNGKSSARADHQTLQDIFNNYKSNAKTFRIDKGERKSDTSAAKTIIFQDGYNNYRLDDSIRDYSPDSCKGYKCNFSSTSELFYYDAKTADMLVFFDIGLPMVPMRKSPKQLWTFISGEAQTRIWYDFLEDWDNLFNYSITYERSSKGGALGLSFGRVFRKKHHQTEINFAEEKRRLARRHELSALWFVSNCRTEGAFVVNSLRTEYALALKDYMKIDAYSKDENCSALMSPIIRNELFDSPQYNDYYFYLAFENSLCRDYITEKFWKIVGSNSLAIPIVLGGISMENYERVAPPNSYIHVYNFTSPKALAEHLKYVMENDDAFNYYHQWRKEYEFYVPERFGVRDFKDIQVDDMPKDLDVCYLCQLAHEQPHQVWESFSSDFSKQNCIEDASALVKL